MADEEPTVDPDAEIHQSRLELIWDVLVFQAKLIVDGLRDVVLVPISMIAAVVGMLIGGSKPNQYFQRVLEFGRRTEHWINLFGQRRTEGTSDEIIKPIQEKVFEEAKTHPTLKKAGTFINKSIDNVGSAIKPTDAGNKDEKT